MEDEELGANIDSARIYRAIPQLGRIREDVLVGDVWKQPELSHRDRILVTCSILAALNKPDELRFWMGRGVANGISADEIRGLIMQVTFYAGWPTGLGAGKALLDLLETKGE